MPKHSEFGPFLNTPEPPDLGPATRPGTQSLENLTKALGPTLKSSNVSSERQELIRALVLLWHDHLDAAHRIAQEIDNPDGAFVHGIMHRREPDFANAAYWFRRVGRHPVFAEIAAQTEPIFKSCSQDGMSARLISGGQWNPFGFIEACEEVAGNPGLKQKLLRDIQRVEFKELLRFFEAS
jgi:hypothetical protein